MFWAGVVGDNLIGPFRLPDGVKMDSRCYIKFMADNFNLWYYSRNREFKQKCTFMHGNAPAHARVKTYQRF